MTSAAQPSGNTLMSDLIRTLRPRQWTKNAIVLAAIFFAFWDRGLEFNVVSGVAGAVAATLLFCLASSAVYVLNDLIDAEADRCHPLKKYRPIAAGRVPRNTAVLLSGALMGVAALGSIALSVDFAIVVAGYVLIQLAYCFVLKRVPLVDVMVIAAGFVLRAIAGAVVLSVPISPWLLLCTFLLALFLSLCKRRHEQELLDEEYGGPVVRLRVGGQDRIASITDWGRAFPGLLTASRQYVGPILDRFHSAQGCLQREGIAQFRIPGGVLDQAAGHTREPPGFLHPVPKIQRIVILNNVLTNHHSEQRPQAMLLHRLPCELPTEASRWIQYI